MDDSGPFLVGLRLSGRAVCVVGDSPDMVRRVRELRRAGADVLVVCDDDAVATEIEATGSAVARRGWRADDFTARMVAVICLSAGRDDAVAAARDAGALVYVPDVPDVSDFVLAAVVRRGPLQVAVSTGGRSPAAARRLAERIDAALPDTTAAALEAMADARTELRAAGGPLPPYSQWAEALDSALDADGPAEIAAAVRRGVGLGPL